MYPKGDSFLERPENRNQFYETSTSFRNHLDADSANISGIQKLSYYFSKSFGFTSVSRLPEFSPPLAGDRDEQQVHPEAGGRPAEELGARRTGPGRLGRLRGRAISARQRLHELLRQLQQAQDRRQVPARADQGPDNRPHRLQGRALPQDLRPHTAAENQSESRPGEAQAGTQEDLITRVD